MADSLSHGIDDGGTHGDMPGDTRGSGGRGAADDALRIRGTVRDSLGVALPRAVVTLVAPGGRQLDKTRSAADGAFSVTAPDAGDYLLAAYSPQLGSQSLFVTLGGQPVQVELRISVPGT